MTINNIKSAKSQIEKIKKKSKLWCAENKDNKNINHANNPL